MRKWLPPPLRDRIAIIIVLLPTSAASGQTSSAIPTHAGPPTGNPTCQYPSWSTPVLWPGVKSGSVISWPSLAVGKSGTYIVGNDIAVLDDQPAPSRPLIALNLDGASLGKPLRGNFFAFPQAVVDLEGVLHVLWAEPDTTEPISRRDFRSLWTELKSVWHSAYVPETGWTEAREFYRTAHRIWWQQDLSGAVLDAFGGLHVAFVDDHGPSESLVHAVFEQGKWRIGAVPTSGALTGYSSIAVSPNGEVYIAYIGPDRSTVRGQNLSTDANSVFLVHSPNGGRSWNSPSRVSRSGQNQATSLRALVSPDKKVHLIWGQNLSGGLAAEVLRHVVSDDRGETWSLPDDLDIPDGARNDLRVAIDEHGTIHVVYGEWFIPDQEQDRGSERRSLIHAPWDKKWGEPSSPFPLLNALDASLASTADGSIRLFTSARPNSETSIKPTFKPFTSLLRELIDAPCPR